MLKRSFNILTIIVLFSTILFAQDIKTGIKLYKNERYNAAKKHFLSQIETVKKTIQKAELYFYLGQTYCYSENMDSARFSFLQGLKNDADCALNYAGLSKIDLLTDKKHDSETNMKKALEISDEENQMVFMVLAEAYSHPKIKNFEKALELVGKALSIKSKNNSDVYLSKAKVYLGLNNGTEVIKNCENILNTDPENPEALTMKARIYLLINLKKEAIGLLEEALKGDSTYSLAYYELAEVYANLKDYTQASVNYQKYIDASEVTIEKQKRLASFLFIDKQYSKSIKILESILSKDNNPESSIRILAYSYMRLDENEKSISYFKQLFDLNLESYLPTDYENYSDLLSKSGDEMQALEYLKKVIATDSSRKDVFGKMSVLYFKNKDWEGVVYSLENKGKLTAQEYFDLSKANIFIGDKNINSAYQGLPQKMDFDDEQTSQLRIALLYYQAELKEALNDSTKLANALSKLENSVSSIMDKKQKPNWETLKSDWLNRVKAIVGTEYGKAESALTSLIEKVPTLAIAYIWQGRVKSNFDPDSEAGLSKPFYEKFIELSNNDVTKFKKELIEAYSYLGYYFYIKEDNTLALQNWEKVLELDPENVQATAVIKQLK